MKEIFLLFFIFLFLSSCEPTQDFKGEIIPESKTILSLLNSEKSQTQKAISYLNQVIEEGSSSHLYYLRAKFLYDARQYKKANRDILKALKYSPRDLDYLLLAGQIAFDLENYTIATAYFNLIKPNVGKQSLILFFLADVAIKVNDLTLANFYLNQIPQKELNQKDQIYYSTLKNLCVLKKVPSTLFVKNMDQHIMNDVRLQRIYFEYALNFTSKFLYQNQLLKLMNENPNDPHLLRFWARFLNQINQVKMAELIYQKVAGIFDHNDYLHVEIGNFYMSHRNYRQAILYFNRIKPDLTSFADVPFLKSKCYLYLGDRNTYQSTLDSAHLLLKNDARFYQLKMKHFGILKDSSLSVKDSLLTIEP
jgi:predicted Zn-dependent protease